MSRWARIAAGCAGLLAAAGTLPAGAAEGPRLRLPLGEIEGVAQTDTDAYLGVPYAQAPVGALRWRPPVAPSAWEGVRPATRFGAACLQDPPRPWGPFTSEFVDLQAPIAEDCLFLNVWTPRPRGRGRWPVVVWIHGGGFGSGAASVPVYDGRGLARRGAVVVSINYRLGIFGFLATPS